MNSFQRVMARLDGGPVDQPSNFDIFMTFAVHHIGQPLSRYYLDHTVLVEANMAVLEGFDLDIVRATRECMRAGGTRWFGGAGCEIPDGTPDENLQAQTRALRSAV
jgi:hypothetical protein